MATEFAKKGSCGKGLMDNKTIESYITESNLLQTNWHSKNAGSENEICYIHSPLFSSLDETTSHSTKLPKNAAKSLVIPQMGERDRVSLCELQVKAKEAEFHHFVIPAQAGIQRFYSTCFCGFLTVISELLQACVQRILLLFFAPSHPRHGRKLPRTADRNDHCHASKKPEWLKDEIIRLKAHMPQAGCRSIADICNRRFAASRKVTVGKTYVHQILQQHDYEIQILRRNLKHAKPKIVPRNLIWGIDLTCKTDAQGGLHFLFGILDHGSRAVLHLQALHNKTSRTLIACLFEVISTHGKPKIIRTDNEAIFTSKIFRLGLKQLGICHQRTDPGCPWQNGRIERLFGTLKQKLDQLTYAPLPQAGEGLGERVREQLNRDLDTFRYWYNHIRPHQNLDGKTPAEAWSGINPYTKPPKQEQWFEAWDGLLVGYRLRY